MKSILILVSIIVLSACAYVYYVDDDSRCKSNASKTDCIEVRQ